MNKGSCYSDTGSKMFCAEEKRRGNAQSREFQYQDGKGTACTRDKQNEEKAADMKREIIIRLSSASFASGSPSEAMNGVICSWSAILLGEQRARPKA